MKNKISYTCLPTGKGVMEQSKRNKLKRGWPLLLKATIAVLALWFIYRRVFEKENLSDLLLEYKHIFSDGRKGFLLLIVFLFMILNWSVEALKWKWMISKIEHVSFIKSLEAVFSGLTISFFTPNRVGEYAGRIFHLETADKMKATLITVIENLSQLLVTVIAGSVSLVFYIHYFVNMNNYFFAGTVVLIIVFVFLCSFLFLNVSLLENLLAKFRFTRTWLKYTEVFGYFSYRELTRVLALSFLRFFIFTFQFYFLLILFDVHVYYPVALMLISMIFYVMSLVPTIALTEIGVRGAVATFFLGSVTDQHLSILNATVSLWLINLVIPALTGIFFVFMFHLEKRKG
ncbi:MAG: lysylphosphatidylglycerol synthase domain-containing protein [Bacteroidetes bacterium]|nr:lysylphosphatidylglycerol synthase domain-containing protein [Bacteroidota bacterium]